MLTKIQWADQSWNPWSGCKKVSSGCLNCYMYRIKHKIGEDPEEIIVKPCFGSSHILKYKSGSFIFVLSMGDFFLNDNNLIDIRKKVWETIKYNPDKIFVLLTKRPQNIEMMLPADWGSGYKNVILGITAEDTGYFTTRWDILRKIPAECYLVSHEPALGFITFTENFLCLQNKAWVIAGGETGYNARPSHLYFFQRDLNQCEAHGIPFFFKHWGEWIHGNEIDGKWMLNDGRQAGIGYENYIWPGDGRSFRLGKENTGELLNGKLYQQFPVLPLEIQQKSLFD